MDLIIKSLGWLVYKTMKLFERLRCKYILSLIKHGENCQIEGFGSFSYNNITMGDNVYIGENCCLISSNAQIVIGSNVMISSHAMLASGNHRINVIGELMINITEKEINDDKDIIIDDDVWIGMGAIVLKGVHIGRGSVIGAGSILTKDIPEYSIYTGGFLNKTSKRFNEDQLLEHHKILYEKKVIKNEFR